jgi:hypothetical protein
MPASRAVRSGHRRNGVQLPRAWLSRDKNLIFLAGVFLFLMTCYSSLQGATVTVTIEFSDQSSRTYTLSKNGDFGSGTEIMGSLIHSLGGGLQVFDDHDWLRDNPTSNPWIQWWRYDFGLVLYGLGLDSVHNSGFESGYWALYTSTANTEPWTYAEVGLADLIPENGSRIGLKYSSFEDLSGPSNSANTADLILPSPPTGQRPRLLSLATISPDRLELTFETTPGCTYQLEENESLAGVGWHAWGGFWVATATEIVFTILVQEDKPKCFYRLHLLP